ncbi:MAG: Gfo/Idh/MocA family oxidoreductase [Planctomycetes bacterium]|nr:Gfo/Idh/MocA family oxidoreductase [Planctomycetota bacterium]
MSNDRSVGVGAVGILPEEESGLLSRMPVGPKFQWVAFSDEGTAGADTESRPVRYYADYNMLLEDDAVELVLVGGPLELRRDLAVRALNADRNVAVEMPFCETALGAERVMKTAFHRNLLATAELSWRDNADLRALRLALEEEKPARVWGAQLFWSASAQDAPAAGLLETHGMEMLDQIRIVVDQDIGHLNARLLRRRAGGPEHSFHLYLSLREGGWAGVHAGPGAVEGLPAWFVQTPGANVVVRDGVATVQAGEERRVYHAPDRPESFWDNLYDVIRNGAAPKCHCLEIVRAMKLHEAALESAETGQSATV